jgi:ABC-2 type transport system ATP-binding protein
VGIIQALMHKPELLILDEPTTGLDPLIRQEFYSLLREVKDERRTIFLSSHVLPEVEKVCDRVGIIRQGKIVAVEEVDQLLKRSHRTVEIVFAADVTAADFSRIRNVCNLSLTDNILRCEVIGEMDPLIKVCARFPVREIITQRPHLEETFLAFYGKNNNAE